MNITLNGLAPGKWRNFSAEEIAEINAMVSAAVKRRIVRVWVNRNLFQLTFYLNT